MPAFPDDRFEIQDGADQTKRIAFQAAGITTATKRIITMPDSDVTLTLSGVGAPTGSVSFNDQQATSFRVENRTSDPGSPTVGQLWLRTDL